MAPHKPRLVEYLRALDAAIWDVRQESRPTVESRLVLDADILWPSLAPRAELSTYRNALLGRGSSDQIVQRRFVLASLLAGGYVGSCYVLPQHEQELEDKLRSLKPREGEGSLPQEFRKQLSEAIDSESAWHLRQWKALEQEDRGRSPEAVRIAASVLSRCTAVQYATLEAIAESDAERQRKSLARMNVGAFDDIAMSERALSVYDMLRHELSDSQKQKDEELASSNDRDVAAISTIIASMGESALHSTPQIRFVTASHRIINWVARSPTLERLFDVDPDPRRQLVDRIGSPFRSVLYCIIRCAHPAIAFKNVQLPTTSSANLGFLYFVSRQLWRSIKTPFDAAEFLHGVSPEIGALRGLLDDTDDLRIALHLWIDGLFTGKKSKSVAGILPVLTMLHDESLRREIRQLGDQLVEVQDQGVKVAIDLVSLGAQRQRTIERDLRDVASTHTYHSYEMHGSTADENHLRHIAKWEMGFDFWVPAGEENLESTIELLVGSPESDLWRGEVRRLQSLLVPSRSDTDQRSRIAMALVLITMGQYQNAERVLMAGCAPLWFGSIADRSRALLLYNLAHALRSRQGDQEPQGTDRFTAPPDVSRVLDQIDDNLSVCYAVWCAARIDQWQHDRSDAEARREPVVQLAKKGLEACQHWLARQSEGTPQEQRAFVAPLAWYLSAFQEDADVFDQYSESWARCDQDSERVLRSCPWNLGFEAIKELAHIKKFGIPGQKATLADWPLFFRLYKKGAPEIDDPQHADEQISKLVIPMLLAGYCTNDREPVDERRRLFHNGARRLLGNHEGQP